MRSLRVVADERDSRAIWAQCERVIGGFKPSDRDPRTTLLALAERAPGVGELDFYGERGLVERLEERVAELLGKEAAVWMPSGTMAQQIALRIHAERRGNRRVAFHPQSPIEDHEEGGDEHLHGLHATHVGPRERPP